VEIEVRRIDCPRCGKVKQEKLEWLADNPFYSTRFAFFVGRRCRDDDQRRRPRNTLGLEDGQGVGQAVHARATTSDRNSGSQDHWGGRNRDTQGTYVSHRRERPFAPQTDLVCGQDRSEQSMEEFFKWLGLKKSKRIGLAVMDMWKAFRNSTLKPEHAPQAAILFDKFHILRHLGEAMDQVRKSEYARLTGKDRRFIKDQKYTLLSHRENLTNEGRRSLRMLLKANKRLNTAYVLKEAFGQLWEYQTEGWARRFFENWRDSLK
jgi:transposase